MKQIKLIILALFFVPTLSKAQTTSYNPNDFSFEWRGILTDTLMFSIHDSMINEIFFSIPGDSYFRLHSKYFILDRFAPSGNHTNTRTILGTIDSGTVCPVNLDSVLTPYLSSSIAASTYQPLLPSQTGNNGKVLSTNGTNTSWINQSSGTVTSVGFSSTDLSVSGSPVTTSSTITADLTTTGVVAGTYFGMFTVDSKGRLTVATTPTLDTLSPSRSFNTPYQMSTTRWVTISPSFSASCSLSLSGGQSAEVYLEWSVNGSTGWTRAALVPSSNTGTLTVGLNTQQVSGSSITLTLPPSYWWRLRTNNVTGTPTYTFTGGSKIIY